MTKQWSRHCMADHHVAMRHLQSAYECRRDAMAELREVSEELHDKACELSTDPWPVRFKHLTATPPVEGYEPSATD